MVSPINNSMKLTHRLSIILSCLVHARALRAPLDSCVEPTSIRSRATHACHFHGLEEMFRHFLEPLNRRHDRNICSSGIPQFGNVLHFNGRTSSDVSAGSIQVASETVLGKNVPAEFTA